MITQFVQNTPANLHPGRYDDISVCDFKRLPAFETMSMSDIIKFSSTESEDQMSSVKHSIDGAHEEIEYEKPMKFLFMSKRYTIHKYPTIHKYQGGSTNLYERHPILFLGVPLARRSPQIREEFEKITEQLFRPLTPQQIYLNKVIEWYQQLSPSQQEQIRDKFIGSVGQYQVRNVLTVERDTKYYTILIVFNTKIYIFNTGRLARELYEHHRAILDKYGFKPFV